MKDQKLIYAMKDIDDDLICEAVKRRSTDVRQEGEEAETVYVSAKRRGQFWRYPVTAAAALAVAVGVMFVINNNGGIPNNMSAATGEETIETVAETDNGEASMTADTDTSSEEMQPPISEVPAPVVPLKVVGSFNDYAVIYVDSYLEIPQNDFGKEYFTEMSTEELLEYYGFFNNIADLIANDEIVEITDENVPHGIYTLPDGSIYDINVFTFEFKNNDMSKPHRFNLTVGKETKFGQEYCAYYEEEGILPGGQYTAFYNEEKDTLFSVHNYDGVTRMERLMK